jgi:hypothetical protein
MSFNQQINLRAMQQNMAKIRSGTQQDKLFDVLSRVVAKHLKPSKDQEQRILKRNNLDRNDGKNYILVVIDIFSRFLWTEPMEKNDKTSTNDAFKKFFKEHYRENRKNIYGQMMEESLKR